METIAGDFNAKTGIPAEDRLEYTEKEGQIALGIVYTSWQNHSTFFKHKQCHRSK